MGLILNTVTNTKQGFEVSTGSYLNISEYYISKNAEGIQLAVNIYKDKAARTEGKEPFQIDEIPSPMRIEVSAEELVAGNIYAVAYGKLKEVLNTAYGSEVAVDDI